MRYELMFPFQIRDAIDKNVPAVLPVGTLEYHSEHCVTGVDSLLVTRALETLEKELEMVLLPPFYYGAASYVVAPPERNGTLHVSSEALLATFRELFSSLFRVGFRNIHVFLHHQTENFEGGMPTDLSLKLASRQAVFSFLESLRGENWWGDGSMADYYDDLQDVDENPFNWIRIHPLMDSAAQEECPLDHAGKQETSLMLAFCPEGVDLGRHCNKHWYAEEAKEAELEYGRRAGAMILEGMKRAILG